MTNHASRITHHVSLLFLILTAYLLITLVYGVVNPLFEAPDEHWHYFTVQYVKDNRALPFVDEPVDPWTAQEAAQPPLYYVLGTAVIAPISIANARDQVWLNPFFYAGDAARLSNVNQVIHTPQEAWPWQGVTLAAHLLRIMSALMGLGTLLCVFGCGRLLWPDNARPALLATAVTAFLPQFNFVHASISNDPLIILLASLALWQLLWLWFHPVTWPRLLLLGITCGLAALTKNAGLLLLAYAVGFLFLHALKTSNFGDSTSLEKSHVWRWLWQTAVFVVLPTLLIAGWMWVRNQQLYGDFTATEPFIRLAEGDRGYTLWQVLGETGGLVRSLFAVFGWFNLLAPTWVYAVWVGIVGTAVLGAVKTAVTGRYGEDTGYSEREEAAANAAGAEIYKRPWFPGFLLFVWLALVYAGLVVFMLRTPAAQGRLLFPAIVPLALALGFGLSRWRWRGVDGLAAGLALLTTLYCAFFVIRPAYALPPPVAELPATAVPLNLDMGEGLTLVGVEMETDTAVPGEPVWFTLYWRATSVPDESVELVAELFGRHLALLGNYHSYHGQGKYPANLWPLGELVADRIGIRLEETAVAPVLARLLVRLADGAKGMAVGEVKVVPDEWPESGEPLAQVGEGMVVTAVALSQETARPGDTVKIDITWEVLAPPGVNLTTLLHLAEAGQPPLATGDNQPVGGQYPTRVWAAGEVIADQYNLTIPAGLAPGHYPVWIGMYDAETGERQPLVVAGERQPHDMWQIGWIEVNG
ncbi:MAG: phospholipid carrier-dependent glycosyltransferase [Anaerolineae bacterium]|nr:phospholipid carrier-dependent glycosyltransferase [Anaerolineae bacterium]